MRPPCRARHRIRAPHRLAAAVAGALVASGLVACSGTDGPEQTVAAFLSGWQGADLHEVPFVTPAGEPIPAAEVQEKIAALSGQLADTPPTFAAGSPSVDDDLAAVEVTVDWSLPGDVRWRYPTTVRLHRVQENWRVIWEPAIVHPQLSSGDELALRRLSPTRAPVLDGAGDPVVAPRPVVVVGVQPRDVTDIDALVAELDAALRAIDTPIDLSDLPDRVASADETAFVEVVSLRREAYDRIRQRIRDLDGTVFREEERQLAPSRVFARALLGTVGEVLREDIERAPDTFVAGDTIGHGGLQGRYDDLLRGQVGQRVVIARAAPDGAVTETEVFRQDAVAGSPLRTTLDTGVQNAADAALARESRRGALVALRISDGAVLAVANGPDAAGENLAFTAQVPPGSTFKMVSTLGLLDAGAVTADRVVGCPGRATVDGAAFRNADGFALGDVPFREAFARSCNTTFVRLAPELGDDGLAAAGATLGLGGEWEVGLDAFTGRVSTGGPPAERAAAAFGQGTTLVSPLAMAAAVAAVARGQWRQPVLLTEPAPPHTAPDGPRLADTTVEPLRAMMREVVTSGTATSLRDVAGGPVHGKTGTAEFAEGTDDTHAWFVGWQGDIAFAVFVERGGSSSDTAVPVAGRFLRALAG